MVTKNYLTFEPKPLSPNALDRDRTVVRYNDLTDTLFLHFYGTERKATILEQENNLSLRIDAQTHEIVGIQIEHFIEVMVPTHPELLGIAELLGIDPERISLARGRIDPERAKTAAVNAILSGIVGDALLAGA